MIFKQKKEIIAMLLAGGQGSRLGVLTKNIAKPAVPFGGKYRIIDFTLSNCVNSNIDTVGVLTQYQPLELNAYIGNGQPWDLDRLFGGVRILPPYVRGKGGEWYKGTANAIYQNINYIDMYQPEYVLILSGDHIYKMNYAKMLLAHKKAQADCTIAVIEVPIEEASRFGVMNADEEGRIYEFEEKPKMPKSNLASMGVYIFTWKKLKEYLELDEANKQSKNDFGKNIIPAMLAQNEKLMAYRFRGYWKDVGTVESLWEANMDLLNPESGLNLDDSTWKIYARTSGMPSHFIADGARLSNCTVSEGCKVEGEIHKSIIFPSTKVGKNAVVSNSIIMPGVVVEEGAEVHYAIIGENSVIGKDAVIGQQLPENARGNHLKIALVGQNISISAGSKVAKGVMIEENI